VSGKSSQSCPIDLRKMCPLKGVDQEMIVEEMEHVGSNLREHSRILSDMPTKYSVVASVLGEFKEISDSGVFVDISDRGGGMLSSYPFEPGQVVSFQNQTEMNNVAIRFAIVRWVNKIGTCRYRVGLKFLRC
jgi:hypothetical protein